MSAALDKTIRVWDLNTGECLNTLTSQNNVVKCVAVTHDGTKIVSGGTDKTVKVWKMP